MDLRARFNEILSTEEQLRAVMGSPWSGVVDKEIQALDVHAQKFIGSSPFLIIGTADAAGCMDLSPKGDPPGFVQILDEKTLVIPDRVGNRRADTFRNLLANDQIGLIFFIPGKQETLRVSGRAIIVRDEAVRAPLTVRGKLPEFAIVVAVEQMFFHCAKCVMRSKLWQPEAWPALADLPSLAETMVSAAQLDISVAEMQAGIDDDAAKRLLLEGVQHKHWSQTSSTTEAKNMGKQVAVGVVGTSWYADSMHLPALKSHPQAKLVAICGRDRARAEEMAQKYEIPQVFTNYQEMLEKAELEALVVAIPDDLHYAVTLAALDAGLHVLCEKPLALTLAQAEAMVARAEAAGVKHMTYFTWRWLPAFQYLHQLIQAGYLGRCFHSQFRYIAGYGRDGDYGWKWDRQRGLGILGDLGVHLIDMAHWCVGDIVKVSAQLSTFFQRAGVAGQPLEPSNDAALLTVKFANGSQGVIQTSAVAHVGDRFLEFQVVLHGEAGTLEVDFNFSDGYVIRGARSVEEQIKPLTIPDDLLKGIDPNTPVSEQLDRIFTEQAVGTRLFIDAIINNQTLSPSFYDGLKAQAVIEAAIQADQQECWVAL